MAVNYAALAATAATLIQDNGQAVTFTYETGEAINPATGVVTTPASETEVSGYGVSLNFMASEINGTTVIAGDMKLICNAVATKPQAGWKVTVDSVDYRVMDVKTLSPAGTDVIYTCQIRI